MTKVARVMTLFKAALKTRERRMSAMKRRLGRMRENGLGNDSYDLAISFLLGELSNNIEELIQMDVSRERILSQIASAYNQAIAGE